MQCRKWKHRGWGAQCLVAITLAILSPHANAIIVNDSAELNAALDNGETVITLGTPDTYLVTGPRTITGDVLSITGAEANGFTARDYVIQGDVGSTGALFDFLPSASATAVFTGIAFEGAINYVQADANVALAFTRCYFGEGAPGVKLNGADRDVTFSQCVFQRSAPGVDITGVISTNVIFYQCTVLESDLFAGTGPGKVSMVLCLFDSTATFSPDPSLGFEWTYSLIEQSANSPVTPDANDDEIPIPGGDLSAPPVFATTPPWPGKLNTAIQSGVNVGNLNVQFATDLLGPDSKLDFEGEIRATANMQIGADEVGPATAFQGIVEIDITGGNRDRFDQVIIGPNTTNPVRIRMVTRRIDLTDAQILVRPETVAVGDTALYSVATLDEVTITESGQIESVFTVPGTCVDGVLMDGRATVYLEADGTILPVASNPFASDFDRTFVIDTIAPKLGRTIGDNDGIGLLRGTNDNLTPPGVTGDYPDTWSAFVSGPLAASAGSILAGQDAQVFLNTDPSIPSTPALNFEIGVIFEDAPPAFLCDGVTPSGIADGGGFYDVSTLTFPLSGGTTGTGDELNSAFDETGIAWLQDNSLPPAVDNTAIGAYVVPGNSTSSDGYHEVGMAFGFNGVLSTDTISMPFFFDAADAAGNRVSVANPLIVWWMPPDTFEGRMSGNTTADNPTFEWNLVRGETPQDANPAYPIARFRLFRSGDPSSSDPPWISVSDWGPWIALDVVTVQTFIGPNLRLGDALRNLPETQGVEVLLAAQMADEAGNLMPISDGVVNLGLDPVTVPDANSFDLIGNYGVPFKTWLNGAVESGYETSIDYRVWYNNTNIGNLRRIEPGASEVNFGNAKRVPIIPEDNCEQRIEVQFLVNADFPVPSEATALSGVEWALYEDSRLVANGNMRLTDLGVTPLTFPTDLFEGGQGNVFVPLTIQRDGLSTAVSTRAFLNDAPSDCGNFADRFGDDGDTPQFRRREVEYTFVAYATAEVGSPNAPRDQTPATVQFSVYVDDDAGPGTTPVKVFTNQ